MNVDVDDISDEGESSDGETLSVGMTFDSGTDALHAVQDHALAHGKAVKLKQRSGVHRFIGCSSEGCELFVRVYRKRRADKTYGPWYISSMNTEHVSCVSSSNPTSRQIAELPTFESAVRADHTVSAPTLTQQIQSRDGISLQKKRRSLFRAKEAVKELGATDLAQAYEKIPNYLSQFAALNPGSVAVAEQDQDGHFKRAIVIVKVFADAVAARQSVVGVDCSHSKCPSYGGMQMHLDGRDGNLRNLTLAVGLVEAEDADNYSWFFSMLQPHGYDFTGVPMFCDRNGALISVALKMGLNLKYCTLHIIRNLLARFRKFTHGHKILVWALQSAETEDLYLSRLAWIGLELGPEIRMYLAEIPPIRWCGYANVGVVPLYGWRTSNFVESVFGSQLIRGMRHLHPYAFIQACVVASSMSASSVPKTQIHGVRKRLCRFLPRRSCTENKVRRSENTPFNLPRLTCATFTLQLLRYVFGAV